MNARSALLLRRRMHRVLGSKVELRLKRLGLALKYDAEQPRDEQGRWVENDSSSSDQSFSNDLDIRPTVQSIAERAGQLHLAARSDAYGTCLDLCYPLLERFQPPGSDRNTWDFHNCMNICLSEAKLR